jgi:hypothetical protein
MSKLAVCESTGELLWAAECPQEQLATLESVAILDRHRILTAHADGSVWLWEQRSGPLLVRSATSEPARLSPPLGGRVLVWDAKGKCMFIAAGRNNAVAVSQCDLEHPITDPASMVVTSSGTVFVVVDGELRFSKCAEATSAPIDP